MNCDRCTKPAATANISTDIWRPSVYEKSLSMSKSDANKVLNAARDGQRIDVLTITAALWVTGDVGSTEV